MAVQPLLLLGDKKLYTRSESVKTEDIAGLGPLIQDLKDTLLAFREKRGVGRAITAPQIGVFLRVIYQNIGGEETVMINPMFEPMTDEMMEVWDDCLCFPGLQVRVRRYRYIRVAYMDQSGRAIERELTGDLSELFQHEYDHLEGVLAVQKAVSTSAFQMGAEDEI